MGSTCGWQLQSLVFEALRTPGIGRTLLIEWFAAALSPEALLSPRMRSLPSGIGGGSGSGKDKKNKKKQKKDDKKKNGQGDEGQDDAAGSPGECLARKGCYGQRRAGTQATATCCIIDSLPHHRQLPPLAPACLSHRCSVCLAAGMAVLGDEDLSLAGDVALADLLNGAHFAAIRLFYAYVDAASLAVPAQTHVVRRHKACKHTLALAQPALSHPPFQSCSRRRPVLPRKAGGRSAEAHRHRRRAAEGGGRAARAAARRRHSSRQHQAD